MHDEMFTTDYHRVLFSMSECFPAKGINQPEQTAKDEQDQDYYAEVYLALMIMTSVKVLMA